MILPEKVKLDDFGVDPCPHIEYQDWDAKYRVEQFAQCARSVVGGVEERVHDHGEGNDG